MSLEDITRRVFTALKECGMPCAHRTWDPAPPPPLPYVVFYRADRHDFMADDSNYCVLPRWCAELYTRGPDDAALDALEGAIADAGWTYETTEVGGSAIGSPLTAAVYFTAL